MRNKFIYLLLVILIFYTPICFAYSDIDNHWASESIESLSKINILNGYADDTFRPDNYITRAELITIVNRILKNSTESTKYIADNNSKEWYYSEIRKAISSGIIKGDSDGKVRPNDYITRQEAIVVLYRAFSNDFSESMKINSFSDKDNISSWALDAFSLFGKRDYIKGYDDNTIRPLNNITRAEVVTLVDRILSEIVVKGQYTGNVYGNLLINGYDASLNDTMIDGDLIIAEGTNGDMKLKNVIVNGNLVMRVPFDIPSKNFKVNGKTIKVYESNDNNIGNEYINNIYGIKFATPDKAKIIELNSYEGKINYKTKNLIVVEIESDENTLFKSFKYMEKELEEKYANLYERINFKEIDTAKMGCYYDKKENVFLILIKRDEIAYRIMLYNVENENVVDNLFNSIQLINGEKVKEHHFNTYKNRKLLLEFDYIDYVGVDDSYNTNVIFEGKAEFMLFIQVTSITDIDKYTIQELKYLFDSLATSEGEILDSKIKKVYRYDAIDYTIKSDEKVSRSLYIVVDKKLYKFIFTGDAGKMNTIGNELFDDIINSIEM